MRRHSKITQNSPQRKLSGQKDVTGVAQHSGKIVYIHFFALKWNLLGTHATHQ